MQGVSDWFLARIKDLLTAELFPEEDNVLAVNDAGDVLAINDAGDVLAIA